MKKLERQEMKNLQGGLVDEGGTRCRGGGCFLYIREYSQWFYGSCSWRGTGSGVMCVCEVGQYETGNGGTSCNA